MWELDGRELEALKGRGGERFARFMDKLIRSHASTLKIPQSEISCQIRVNVADGGVDTKVSAPAEEDAIGWFSAPTTWQYKAAPLSPAEIRAECSKSEVLRLAGEGYAYRIASSEDLTPKKKAELEAIADDCIRSVHPEAPASRIVTAADIAAWASFYPAMVGELRPLPDGLLNIEQWSQRSVVTLTREYVVVPGWEGYAKTLSDFCDFAQPAKDACLHVLGEAGVGKTRFVYEVLSDIDGMAGLLVYAENEQGGLEVTKRIVDDRDGRAFVVIDECTTERYRDLQQLVLKHGDRVRCVCLNNTGIRSPSVAGEIWLEKIPVEIVSEILERNFPDVPSDRRKRYAGISEGYVRLAADLCQHHADIQLGDLTPALNPIRDYVTSRIRSESDRDVLMALSLFPRVGARDDVQGELKSVCELLDLRPNAFHDAARRLKDSPGFIAIAGRYYYLTPLIVAQSFIDQAWERWVAPDAPGFVQGLSRGLQERFLTRIPRVASATVRRQVADMFQAWVLNFTPEMFLDPDQATLFVRLCETTPSSYLPLLRARIETADESVLRAMRHEYGAPDTRRDLVWMAERLALFAEHYEDVEAILFRLAECETETYGNNATGIWRQLHHIWLSGTSRPFAERMEILAVRLADAKSQAQFELALSGLAEVFDTHHSRIGSPDTVAGRIPPEDWRPKTVKEDADCWRTGMEVLRTLIEEPDSGRREGAIALALRSCSTFLRQGLLPECRTLFASVLDREDVSIGVLQAGEQLIERVDRVEGDDFPEEYRAELEAWLNELRPTSFSGKLRRLVRADPWRERIVTHEGEVQSEACELVRYALSNPEEHEQMLPWLLSEEALNAYGWGHLLATEGGDEALFRRILKRTASGESAALARGFLNGMRRNGREVAEETLAEIDRLITAAPRSAFEILTTGGDAVGGLQRLLGMVDAGLVPRSHLMGIAPLIWDRPLEVKEIEAILDRLVSPETEDDNGAAAAGLHLLHFLLHSKKNSEYVDLWAEESIRERIWMLFGSYLTSDRAVNSYEIEELLWQLLPHDVARVVRFSVDVFKSRNLAIRDEAVNMLSNIATDHPELVWAHLSDALLSDEQYALQFVECKSIITKIDDKLIKDWLAATGAEGARRLAYHLPPPFVDDSGTPVVPPLTDKVLREYAEDDGVLSAFFIGVSGTESWWGNGAKKFKAEAERAKKFLRHDNPGIRKWAESEVQHRLDLAAREQREEEERFLD